MASTFCNRCESEGCALWDELAELDASPERIIERYDLKRNINRFHSPIIRQIPTDVISIIFEFCLTDFADHQLSPYDKMDLSIPLSLGAICSYWREIAWSTPTLWSSLVVRFSSGHDSHMVTSITQEWLSRSGQLPLSICILAKHVYDHVPALANIINNILPVGPILTFIYLNFAINIFMDSETEPPLYSNPFDFTVQIM
jgi:hypothetical protein